MADSHEFQVVMVSAPADTAQPLARTLVERGLAARVNVVPGVHSVFSWHEGIQESEESILLIKTRAGAIPAIEELMEELQPHQVFELIALPIEHGTVPYLNWILGSVKVPDDDDEREWFMH